MSKNAGPGGTKGEAVQVTIKEHPDWTRAQVAEAVGCTVARVGEVVRSLGLTPPAGRKPSAPHTASQEVCEEGKPQRGARHRCGEHDPHGPLRARESPQG